MNPLIVGASVGTAFGSGLLIVTKGIVPARPPLVKYIQDSTRPRASRPTTRTDRLLDSVVTTGADASGVASDLAVLGRSQRDYAISRVTLCGAFGGLPVIVAILTATAAGTDWNPALVAAVAISAAGAGFVISRATLASEAAARRQSFVAELAAYLDIVGQLLSGGAGVEDALWRAARNARSPGVIAIRDCLASARTRRRSEWAALGELAQRTRVPELTELVTAVQLASMNGAKVSASLIAKAHSLRDRNASTQLAEAQRASERMGGPLIGMLLAFLALVIAPALAAVLTI